ncbi:MAG: macrophage infectivity potentiator Mip [Bacteroidia bacterium]
MRFAPRTIAGVLLLLLGLAACQPGAPSTKPLATEIDSISYAVGMDIARFYQKQHVALDPHSLYQGFRDVTDSGNVQLTEDEALATIGKFQQKLQVIENQRIAEQAISNKIIGEKFLESNREREGVVVLPSGMQYKVLETGTGASPRADNWVRVHYTGRFIDGSQFIDTRNTPPGTALEVKVDSVIAGWTQALLMMKPGDRWELYIPAELAYGEAGRGTSVPPNSTLIFDVELLEIVR